MEKVEAKSSQCPLTLLPQALRLRTPAWVSTEPPAQTVHRGCLLWVELGCRGVPVCDARLTHCRTGGGRRVGPAVSSGLKSLGGGSA